MRLSGATYVGPSYSGPRATLRIGITATRIIICAQIAIPAAVLCITRRLYHISSLRVMSRSTAEKRRDVIIDLVIGLGIPVLEMILGGPLLKVEAEVPKLIYL
jgi:hypothetical protein